MPSNTLRMPRAGTSKLGAGVAAVAASAGLIAVPSTALAESAAPLRQLLSDHLAKPSAPSGLLRQGSSGNDVAELQGALDVSATGNFTGRTRRAVLSFQRRKHLIVDGIVGVRTWDALFHITPPPTTSVATDSTGSTAGGYSIPASIVECESGGNYSAVNASSGAGGAYQILPSTWAAYGGQGLPEDASPAEQSAIAARIYATQGPSAWSC